MTISVIKTAINMGHESGDKHDGIAESSPSVVDKHHILRVRGYSWFLFHLCFIERFKV